MKRAMKPVRAWMLVNKFDSAVYYVGDDDTILVYERKADARKRMQADSDRIARVEIREIAPRKRKPT